MKPILNPFTGDLQMINADGTPGAGIVVKGAYNASTDYTIGDSVSYLGSSYVMYVDAAAGTLPTDTTKWQVIANKGADGITSITTSTPTNLAGFLKGNGSVVSADNSTYSTDIHSNITALNLVTNTNTGDQDLSGKVDKVAGSRLITTAEGTILGNTSNTNSGDNATNTQYSGLTQYTDELAQDAIGGMVDTTLTYTDATPLLKVTNPVTPQTTGFTISAGTTPKTLTVADTASVTGTNTGDATSLGLHAKADTAGAADTAVSLATGTDRTKLDSIASGANVGVVPNAGITGATKTKITYDAKGLVTVGADATTADISDSTNKRYVTDANLTVIGNTSGTNSGNQDLSGYELLSNKSTDGALGTSDTLYPSQKATKTYVDQLALGLVPKPSAHAATTTTLPTNTYNNGSSGVGATLTAITVGVLTVDGIALALNDYVLVKNETLGYTNGLYVVTTAGAIGVAYILTRDITMNQSTEFSNSLLVVENGTSNAGTIWLDSNNGSITVGTTVVTFTQIPTAGAPIAGTGISVSGTTIAIDTGITVDKTTTQTMTGKTIDGVTPTVMGYVDPTSSIQTQLNSKQATGAYLTTVDISANTNLAVSAPIVLTGDTLSIPAATASVNGYATSTQITKLDGIATGAEVNVNADWNSSSGDSQISNKPTLGTAAAKNIPATGDASATEVVYGSDTRLTNARTPSSTLTHAATHVTGSTDVIASAIAAGNAGLMTGTDKTKLDGITASATANAKISGSTLDSLTDDTGFVTAKAVSDGHNVPHAVPGTSRNLLTSNGTDWVSSAPPTAPTQQIFTTGTAQTYTTPAGVLYIKVTVVGGGGGGGNSGANPGGGGGGGGGGGAAKKWITSPSATYTYSVGALGTGGSGAGGTTSFGSNLCATSGGAVGTASGTSGVGVNGGAGGIGTYGDILIAGTAGSTGSTSLSGVAFGAGGAGGHAASEYGGGGGKGTLANVGEVGRNYGGGGAGSCGGAQTGANGAAGIIVVEEFY